VAPSTIGLPSSLSHPVWSSSRVNDELFDRSGINTRPGLHDQCGQTATCGAAIEVPNMRVAAVPELDAAASMPPNMPE
jgi:hypothetical protein